MAVEVSKLEVLVKLIFILIMMKPAVFASDE